MTRVRTRTRKPTPAAPPAEAYDRLPRVALTATAETLWLTRFDAAGQPEVTYPVTVTDVANTFRGLGGTGSGVLPEHVLFWQATDRGARMGLWLPPAARTLRWAVGRRVRRFSVPMPGLVLVGQGVSYSVFAAKERPASEKAPLFHAPLANVNDNGLICAGTVKFTRCTPSTLAAAADLFFESEFNADLSADKVASPKTLLNYLLALRGKRRFPLDALKLTGITLGDVIAGRGDRARLTRGPVARVENAATDPLGVLDDEDDADENEGYYDDEEWEMTA